MIYYYTEKDTMDDYKVDVYAPGLEKEKFDVKLEGKTLVVSYPDEFTKSFKVPSEDVEVHYKDGVLKIEVLRKSKNIKVT